MYTTNSTSTLATSFLHSIKTKFILLSILSCLAIYLLVFTIFVRNVRISFQESTSNYMRDICSSYSNCLDLLYIQNNNKTLSIDILNQTLENVGVKGMKTSYAYLVSDTGTMLYHPISEKIGLPVENTVIQELVTKLHSGNIPENQLVAYTFKGIPKFASYTISPINHQILVITLDLPELDGALDTARTKSFIFCSIALLIIFFITYLISSSICKPLNILKIMIDKISSLDLTSFNLETSLLKRKDEMGAIANSMFHMRERLHSTIESLSVGTSLLNDSSTSTLDLSYQIADIAVNNSATTEELAAAMEETSASSTAVGENINSTTSQMNFILEKTQAAFSLSQEIMKRALALENSNKAAGNKAIELFESVKFESREVLENVNEAKKISQLTGAIIEISRQTSLLSLNASIEAARAGDNGKGFSVVAKEIGDLAAESANITTTITEISTKVTNSIDNMTNCLDKVLNFIEHTVVLDYKRFINAGTQYHNDASTVMNHLNEINSCAKEFNTLTLQINDCIHGINSTVQESTISISNIAEKTADFTRLTNIATDNATNISKCTSDFENLISQFKL
ncbi:methyl-accepting chemotaxis protein [Cellulosilyticum ruminicola]|uniref:methyl-accepting chemotaxis protein n=1 Tax=Cellulosilyticum ruminicola TaxID=425254 RepID=UPI0006D1812A|nr:methyl-accepting chemotaxis protein [Cellulosilyticum ruminicola]